MNLKTQLRKLVNPRTNSYGQPGTSHEDALLAFISRIEQEAYERGRREALEECVEVLGGMTFADDSKCFKYPLVEDPYANGWYCGINNATSVLKSILTYADRIKEDFGDVLSKLSKE